MKEVVLFGASGHAKVAIDIFERSGKYKILGLLVSDKRHKEGVFGYGILGDLSEVPSLLEHTPDLHFFVAIGDNWTRSLITKQLLAIDANIEFANAIHPDAVIGRNVVLGRGVMVMAGSIINADSTIGDFTIVNTKSSVGHECVLEDFCSLAPNSTLAGNVRIGGHSAISPSATILNGRTIGEHSVVGAGALLLEDVGDLCVYYGLPAKFIRSRKKGDKYL